MIGGISGFSGFNTASASYKKPAADLSGGDAAANPVKGGLQTAETAGKKIGENSKKGCETCDNRKYQDGSNDAGVSFKSPQKVAKGAARAMVAAHEQEHVTRNQSKADREGREVISSSVQIHSGICTECGSTYVSGGTTKTVTANKKRFDAGLPDPMPKGSKMDKTA